MGGSHFYLQFYPMSHPRQRAPSLQVSVGASDTTGLTIISGGAPGTWMSCSCQWLWSGPLPKVLSVSFPVHGNHHRTFIFDLYPVISSSPYLISHSLLPFPLLTELFPTHTAPLPVIVATPDGTSWTADARANKPCVVLRLCLG